jgi:RNA polymerase sigma factor (sigma-70 family)
MDDVAFREGIRARHPPSWEHLESLYGASLLRQAALILPPWQDPENAVGDVWLRAITRAATYDPVFPPYPWLARICVNTCLNQKRSLVRVILDSWQRRREAEEPPRVLEKRDARGMLRVALAQLPPREREVVSLRFLFEVSVSEIAAVLRMKDAAVHQALFRGLARLRRDRSATLLVANKLVSMGKGRAPW